MDSGLKVLFSVLFDPAHGSLRGGHRDKCPLPATRFTGRAHSRPSLAATFS